MKIIAKLPKIFYSSACSSDLRQYHIRITISDFPGCNESFTSSNSLPVANSPTTGFLTGTSLYPNVARRAEIPGLMYVPFFARTVPLRASSP